MYRLKEPNGTQSSEQEKNLRAGHPANVQWDPPHEPNFKKNEPVTLTRNRKKISCIVTNVGKWDMWKKSYPYLVRVEGPKDDGRDLAAEEDDLSHRKVEGSAS